MRVRVTMALIAALLLQVALAGCGSSTPPRSGVAAESGGVQHVSVDLSQGYYAPEVIEVKAGVPLEITFGQGEGCLSSVLIEDFGIDQDLSHGGAVVRLPAMKAGTYDFSCGMRMVYGRIVVK